MDKTTFRKVVETLMERYHGVRPLHVSGADPFKVLVGAMLSHRTRDEKTDRAFQLLFSRLPTMERIAGADVREIARLIRDVGFYRQKAGRLRDVARIILTKYGGVVPTDREKLMELPGVGPKTADIVLTHAFGKAEIAVDTHVETVAKRLGLADEDADYDGVKEAIRRLADSKYLPVINGLFVEFGREVCRRPRPRCHLCPVSSHCKYFQLFVS